MNYSIYFRITNTRSCFLLTFVSSWMKRRELPINSWEEKNGELMQRSWINFKRSRYMSWKLENDMSPSACPENWKIVCPYDGSGLYQQDLQRTKS